MEEKKIMNPAEESIASKVEGLKGKIDQERAALDAERADYEKLAKEYEEKVAKLQAQLAELGEQVEEEQPEEVVEDKKKVFKPKFEDLVEIANGLMNENIKVSGAIDEKLGTGTLKYSVGKTLFLLLQKTSSDYRVTFMALEKNVVKYLSGDKRFSIPKNAKSQNMIKFVNKGSAEAGLVKGIVKEAFKGVEEELARLEEAKKAAKEAKKLQKAQEK